ncbi:MAG: carbamoyltransferase C-terminal domain-containing protein [Methanopyri archaeon]|nr:carbamoyltransferase C-terminal domain-containing protein [Methanopyri archaeon]
MDILGVWDGHDAGVCVVRDGRVIAAANEERFTRRKLEVHFPHKALAWCLGAADLGPADVEVVAGCTSDFSVTLGRIWPKVKEDYYPVRRHKVDPPWNVEVNRLIQNATGKLRSNRMFHALSKRALHSELARAGFDHDYILHIVDHHEAHAAAAALCSGFRKSLVVTMDALGDGVSTTIGIGEDGDVRNLETMATRDSLGLFYQEVTHLIGMRVLEDEGKVMSLADFAYGVPDEKNPFLDLYEVNGMRIRARLSPGARYKLLQRTLWRNSREQFAHMAQRAFEHFTSQLFANAVKETGLSSVAWNGGIASNIKMNMHIRLLPDVKEWFVFPHMGDGGLAIGAALKVAKEVDVVHPERIPHIFLGPEYGEDEVLTALNGFAGKVRWERSDDAAGAAAERIAAGDIVFWYNGRMELGPRALGNRSILARADSPTAKNDLNMRVKKRVWFQPFCPSVLEEDCERFFADVDSYDRFMTMGYMVQDGLKDQLRAVINVDGSSRPQMLGQENPAYRRVIEGVRKETGDGIVLNTSFNVHGQPIVCTPEDALKTFVETGVPLMALGDVLVEQA